MAQRNHKQASRIEIPGWATSGDAKSKALFQLRFKDFQDDPSLQLTIVAADWDSVVAVEDSAAGSLGSAMRLADFAQAFRPEYQWKPAPNSQPPCLSKDPR
jgi:hypothetical protein